MKVKMMKRTLSLLLALVLLMGNFPAVAFATEEVISAPTEVVAEETVAPIEAATEEPIAATETPAEGETVVPTEMPEPEETAVPTEAVTEPMEETTEPTLPAVPGETSAPTEPVVEETVAPTESVEETIPIETAVPTEAETEPEEETDVPAEEERDKAQIVVTHETIVLDMDLPGNEELFEAYAEQVLYGTQIATFGRLAGDRLNEDNKLLYDALVPVIKEIANGDRASVTVSIGQTTTDDEGNTYVPDVEVIFPGMKGVNAYDLIWALAYDMPYELYWCNLYGGNLSVNYFYADGMPKLIQITFPVAPNYRGTESNTVDTAKTGWPAPE